MRRRDVLRTLGAAGAAAISGCSDRAAPKDSLMIGATRAFVAPPAEEDVAGTWLVEEFRARTETEVSWATLGGLAEYEKRTLQDRPLGADAFLGVTSGALATARRRTPGLFGDLDVDTASVADRYAFDPMGRVLPVTASNVCVVYDETRIEAPSAFDDLLTSEYAADLLVPDPRTDALGRAFYLWSVQHFGLVEATDRWRECLAAGTPLVASTRDAHQRYRAGDAPMVVAPATTTLSAASHHLPLERYRVRFLDDAAYRHVAGVGRFQDSANPENARAFAAFLLDPTVQGRLAVLTSSLPVTTDADLPKDFETYVRRPARTVTTDVETLTADLDEWLAAWQRTVTAVRTRRN